MYVIRTLCLSCHCESDEFYIDKHTYSLMIHIKYYKNYLTVYAFVWTELIIGTIIGDETRVPS